MCEFKTKKHPDFAVVTFFILLWRNIKNQTRDDAAHCLFIYHVLLAMLGSELNLIRTGLWFFDPHSLCFCATLCLSNWSLSMSHLHKWPGASAQTWQTVPAAVSTQGEDARGWNADTDCSQLVNPSSKQHRDNAYSRSTFNKAIHRISLSSVNCPIMKPSH